MDPNISKQLRRPEGDLGREVGRRMNISNRLINQLALEAVDPQNNEVILEIGMGNGHFVSQLFEKAAIASYTGLDYSDVMVEEATNNNKALVDLGKVTLVQGSAEYITAADATFSKILSVNTLYFWDEPVFVLQELRRVLQPKGKLVIAIRPKASAAPLSFVREGFTLYTKEEAEELLQAHGFTVESSVLHEEPPQHIDGQERIMSSLIITAV